MRRERSAGTVSEVCLDDPVAQCFDHRVGFGVDLQFVEDIADVEFDGVVTDPQMFGRGGVVVTFDQ